MAKTYAISTNITNGVVYDDHTIPTVINAKITHERIDLHKVYDNLFNFATPLRGPYTVASILFGNSDPQLSLVSNDTDRSRNTDITAPSAKSPVRKTDTTHKSKSQQTIIKEDTVIAKEDVSPKTEVTTSLKETSTIVKPTENKLLRSASSKANQNLDAKSSQYKDEQIWLSDNVYTSQIKSPYYTGDKYSVEPGIYTWKIKNLNRGTSTEIDFKQFESNMSSDEKTMFRNILLKLPAEVLFDLSKEQNRIIIGNGSKINTLCKKINTKIGSKFYSGGFYDSTTDTIYSNNRISSLVHELGHAIDNTKGSKNSELIGDKAVSNETDSRRGYNTDNSDYKKVFNEELNMYKANGGKQFSYSNPLNEIYCTALPKEMFAECYTLLMTGDCYSKDVILKHFPKSLEMTKQYLEKIRALPDGYRH